MSFVRRNRVPLLLCAAAAVCLAWGVMQGQDQTVFRKAVNICMECIGLG